MADYLKFIVTSEYDGMNAGRYLRVVCSLSSRTLSKLKRTEGGLKVNGDLLRSIDIVHSGDIIEINLPAEKSETVTPVEGDLDVLYEDNFLLIVNKPPFMPVHPVKVHQTDTLANRIAYRYKEKEFVFRAVNRLDSNTSGIVIISKDRHTASVMQTTDIIKHYTALCHGIILEKGTVDAPISLRKDSKIVRCVDSSGQNAVTHYNPIDHMDNATMLDIVLETGRTHQIRCHMSHIGYPLFGDDLYGGSREHINRQALHCHQINFIHPFKNENICISAPLPDDMQSLINLLKTG
ncbi:MAG: RluA family pseudouridine synthase [Ruminococcaceae bacterium]|nr:RluA family pseudouridine synthase [Oscillospiraceae bacterium]